jgi:predicted transcriptional regulator
VEDKGLSRTLKRFAQVGIIGFQNGPGRTRVPALMARGVRLEIDLAGRRSAVTVDG